MSCTFHLIIKKNCLNQNKKNQSLTKETKVKELYLQF